MDVLAGYALSSVTGRVTHTSMIGSYGGLYDGGLYDGGL